MERIPTESRENIERANENSSEQLESIGKNLERKAESSKESPGEQIEKAREKAIESAISVEAGGSEKDSKRPRAPSQIKRKSTIDKSTSYKKTLRAVQSELPVGSRIFSKVIHNPVVEKVSDVAGNTVARPNAMLSGAVFAFILTLGVYILAKTLGYRLSGFETIGAFILGWVLGLIYDYARILVTGNKK
jgi:hypothetical protein